MKKIMITLFVLAFVLVSYAQTKIAIKAGYNYSFARVYFNDIKQPSDSKNGYGIGILFKAPIEGVVHFSPYIAFNSRGFVIRPLADTFKKAEFSIQYIDFVPALSFDLPTGGNSFDISVGPVFGFTSFGHQKVTNNNDVTTSKKLTFGYGSYGWIDIGLSGSLGYHMKKVFFEAGYFLGLANINNDESNIPQNIRNRMVSLNIGYYIK